MTRPGSRLPLLFGLLAVTAGLAAVALRQLRREQELARLRADFTSSVSHELRTPLTQILLFAETLELGRAGGEGERRQALGIIVQEARRLAHLVENVLQLSRAERRMVRVRTEEQPLAPLLRETAERFAPLAAGRRPLDTELDATLVAPVHADSLRQIVHQPARQRGEVRRWRRAGLAPGRARGRPRPAGGGRRGARHRAGGSGEGVGAVRAAGAVAGGGRERYRARGRARAGRGAWRTLLGRGGAGRRDPGRGRAAPGPARGVGGGGLMARVLIIEDNRNLALGLRTNLEFEGHEAEIARDGTAGLIRARTRGHDLIVLDLMLPGLDGFRVLEALRAEGLATPVLVLTARGDESDKVRGLRAAPTTTSPSRSRCASCWPGWRRCSAGLEPRVRQRAVPVRRLSLRRRGGEPRHPSRDPRRPPGTAPPQGVRSARRAAPPRGRVVGRAELLREVWGYHESVLSRTLDTHVGELRRKLEARPRGAEAHPHRQEDRLPAGA